MALHSTIFTLLFFSLEKLQRRDVKWVQRKGQMFIWITNYIFSQVDWEMLHQLSIVWLYCLKVKTKTELRTEVTQADPERLPADWIIWVKYEYHKEQVRNNTRNHLRDQQELPESVANRPFEKALWARRQGDKPPKALPLLQSIPSAFFNNIFHCMNGSSRIITIKHLHRCHGQNKCSISKN